jgi:hypothetical protein
MIDKDSRPSGRHLAKTKEYVEVLLPALRYLARRHGYALAVHGSLERDIDLIAVPWQEYAQDAVSLVSAMRRACEAITGFAAWPNEWTEGSESPKPIGAADNPNQKPHGRMAWSILLGGGPYIDISVMPRITPPPKDNDGAP